MKELREDGEMVVAGWEKEVEAEVKETAPKEEPKEAKAADSGVLGDLVPKTPVTT